MAVHVDCCPAARADGVQETVVALVVFRMSKDTVWEIGPTLLESPG